MKIHMTNCSSTGNGGDGIRIEGALDVKMTEVTTSDNGGKGINIIPNQKRASTKKRWFEKPLGILFLGICVTVGGGGILKYLGWI